MMIYLSLTRHAAFFAGTGEGGLNEHFGRDAERRVQPPNHADRQAAPPIHNFGDPRSRPDHRTRISI